MKAFIPLSAIVVTAIAPLAAQQATGEGQTFRFRTGVELINVTATVTDQSGRFVSGLRKEDFRVYEDDRLQTISHFSSERVPVSLGIVLDTSNSMEGEKMLAARAALDRFLSELLGPEDEIFLYRFDNRPELVEGWTTDKRRISSQLRRIRTGGATSLYDAVAEAIPLAQSGRHRKKALVVISDGNDTNSHTRIAELKTLIRETEVLVYAIGIDAQAYTEEQPFKWWPFRLQQAFLEQSRPVPRPFPRPRGPVGPPRGPTPGGPSYPPIHPPRFPTPPVNTPAPRVGMGSRSDDRVNAAALRDITDDSGGRTEIVRSARDLDPATAGIADELSKQYYIGYPAAGEKDGRWHAIRVEVRNGGFIVRARKGYVATP